jgi:exodeoxyribonuclease-1
MTTFYFYDLETSGFNPREARVMQFGGQRTDMNLEPIGEPHNFFIKLSEDILPDPDAVLVTGITPGKTQADGITEAEFLKTFHKEIATDGTIFVGFNTVRFDDEFMRFMQYRNFYDPYEWQWQDGKSRWDLLDVVRMTRALRPEGIKWPFDSSGVPSNKLTDLTAMNKLDHTDAHDALNDVMATISLARLLRQKQPKLFDYLLRLRDKKELAKFVKQNPVFLYTSGKYSSEFEKTTLVATMSKHPTRQGVLVYDLRQDPEPFLTMTPEQLVEVWRWQEDPEALRLPVKTLQFNRCPAVAPPSVLDTSSQERLHIDIALANQRKEQVTSEAFVKNILKAQEIMDKQQQAQFFAAEQMVDAQLYDKFLSDTDRRALPLVRGADPKELNDLTDKFTDERLKTLLPLYKARNHSKTLTAKEREDWEEYRIKRLMSGGDESRSTRYFARISQLRALGQITKEQESLLAELEQYGRKLLPSK